MFTWWQQPPHLHNQAALETLRDFMLQGQIRPTAVAAMIFDAKYGRDAGDYRIYRKYAVGENAWADTVRAGLKKMRLSADNRQVDRLPPSRVTADFY